MGACGITNGGGTGLLARFCGRTFTSALAGTAQDSVVCGKNFKISKDQYSKQAAYTQEPCSDKGEIQKSYLC